MSFPQPLLLPPPAPAPAHQDAYTCDQALLAALCDEQACRHREYWDAVERQVLIAFELAGRPRPDLAAERAYLRHLLATYDFKSRLSTWLALRIVQRARQQF